MVMLLLLIATAGVGIDLKRDGLFLGRSKKTIG